MRMSSTLHARTSELVRMIFWVALAPRQIPPAQHHKVQEVGKTMFKRIIAASVIVYFEETLARLIALAAFTSARWLSRTPPETRASPWRPPRRTWPPGTCRGPSG